MTQSELTVGTAQHHWPFSRGLIVESLINAGSDGNLAAAVARRVEQKLRSTRQSLISPEALHVLMTAITRDMVGNDLADMVTAQTPAFVDILVRAKKGTLPFSRGILARTLEDTGLSTRDAYRVASEVSVRIRQAGLRELTIDALDDFTEQMLAERYGEQLRLTYRFLQHNRGRLGVVSDGASPTPFSKGILVQSLLAAGVAPDVARKIARITQRDLRGHEDRVVTRQAVQEKVETLLHNEVGPDISARYRLLRVIRRPPRPLIVLLGGVSGTGKSYLAAEIAYRLGITRVISTDSIREVMRAMVAPELVPTLHASTFNAWETLVPPGEAPPERPTKFALLAGFREQVQQVSVGLNAVVRRSLEEGTSVVLEGVHLVPGYLRTEAYGGAIVVPMLVTLPNEEEHRRHFEIRERETAASRPLHHYMPYFADIRALQNFLEELARRIDIPLLDGHTLDESAEQAVDVVLRKVMSALSPQERIALLGSAEPEIRTDH